MKTKLNHYCSICDIKEFIQKEISIDVSYEDIDNRNDVYIYNLCVGNVCNHLFITTNMKMQNKKEK